MRLAQILKRTLKRSGFYDYVTLNRDAWISDQAQLIAPGSRVLDVGAGSCPYRQLFTHCDYMTQDFGGLEQLQLRDGGYGKIDYSCDATEIPAPDGYFDAILCTEMLEHVPNPIAIVGELGRLLRPGGTLILTAPLGSGIHQEPYHYYGGYTPYWYKKFLEESGFTTITVMPNAGSIRVFGWESIRFMRLTSPVALNAPLLVRMAWAIPWLFALPFLAGLIPVMSHFLDRYDTEQRFTAGYHVLAIKGPS